MPDKALIELMQKRGLIPQLAPQVDQALLQAMQERGLIGQPGEPAPATVGEPGEVGDVAFSAARSGEGFDKITDPEFLALQQQRMFGSDPTQGMMGVLKDLDPNMMVYEDDSGPFVVQETDEGTRKFYFNKEGLSASDVMPVVGGMVVGGPAQKGAAVGKVLGRVGQLLGLTGGAAAGSGIRQRMAGEEVKAKDVGYDVAAETIGSGVGRAVAAAGRRVGQKLGIESLENRARSTTPQGELDERAVEGARAERDTAKEAVGEAYEQVGGLAIPDDALRAEMGQVGQVLRRSDVLVSDNTPAAKAALDELQSSLQGAGRGDVKWRLDALEDYRRKLFVNTSPANSADARALGVLRKHYDDSVTRAGIDALGEGNVEAIEQLKKARGMHAKFNRMFNDPDAVEMVVKPEDLAKGQKSADEVMQRIMGVSAVSNAGSARMLKQIKTNVSGEVWRDMKESFYSRLFRGKDGMQLEPEIMVRKVRELLNAKKGVTDLMLTGKEKSILQKVAATDPLNMNKRLQTLGTGGSILGVFLDPYKVVRLTDSVGSAVGGLAGVTAEKQMTPQDEQELKELMQRDWLQSLQGQ